MVQIFQCVLLAPVFFLQGAAFGFSTIAAHAQEQLAPHLSALVPRLYRYKYDPKPDVQQSMKNIWSAVVPESNKAVSCYPLMCMVLYIYTHTQCMSLMVPVQADTVLVFESTKYVCMLLCSGRQSIVNNVSSVHPYELLHCHCMFCVFIHFINI